MSKKKLIIFFLGTAFFWTFFYSHFAYGGIVEWFVGGLQGFVQAFFAVCLKIVNFFMSLLVGIAYFFAALVGSLLKWVVTLDVPLTHCPDNFPNCVIKVGWTLTRDFSNVLLIFIFIIIVFATILGFETYGMRRLLPKLLLVALLINFSQLICGIPVDIASVFMKTFFGGKTDLVDKITNGPLTSFGGILDHWWSSDTFNFQKQSAFFMQTIFLILFAFGFTFLVGLYVLIFFLRIPVLWTLTILSPLAFVSMILPGPPGFPFTRSFWEEWISQFLQWTFIGVFAMFFLWLGVHLVHNLGDSNFNKQFDFTSVDIESEAPEVAEAGGQMNAFIQNALGFSVLLGFLALGAMFTFRTNLWFAGAVMGTAAGIYAKYVSPTAIGARIGRWGAKKGERVKEGVKERARKAPIAVWEKIPDKLKKIPYKVPGVKVGYEEYKRGVLEEEKEKFEEARKKVNVYSLSQLPDMIAEYRKYKPFSKEMERRALAGVERLLEEGKYEKLKEKLGAKEASKLVNAYIKKMDEMGKGETIKEIIKKNPQLLSEKEGVGEAREFFKIEPEEEGVYKNPLDKFFAGLKRRDYEDISADALKEHPEVLDALLQRVDVDGLVILGSKPEIRDIIQKRWAEIKEKKENERTPEEKKIFERADNMWKQHQWRLERAGYLKPGEIEKRKEEITRFKSVKEKEEAERRKKEIEEKQKRMDELLGKEGIPDRLKQSLESQKKALEEEKELLEKRIKLTNDYIQQLEQLKEEEEKASKELKEALEKRAEELGAEERRMLEEELRKSEARLAEIKKQIEEFKEEKSEREEKKGVIGRIVGRIKKEKEGKKL